MTPLFKKLNLGDNKTILVLNAPDSFEIELSQISGVTIQRKVSSTSAFALGFAMTREQLDRVSATLVKVSKGDAIVWVAYLKATSKRYAGEFNRDNGWTVLGNAGFEPVRQVSIDADWTALRFRRTAHIKSFTRSNAMAISAEGKRRTRR
ncbi:MAG: hypothetical protein FJ145_20155 [Deltaproteobacteria bacterium]|nr:hypothetical protein [Deltaproteobacteria bacterium]